MIEISEQGSKRAADVTSRMGFFGHQAKLTISPYFQCDIMKPAWRASGSRLERSWLRGSILEGNLNRGARPECAAVRPVLSAAEATFQQTTLVVSVDLAAVAPVFGNLPEHGVFPVFGKDRIPSLMFFFPILASGFSRRWGSGAILREIPHAS